MSWPWNPGQRSLKVIESGAIRQIVRDFLLLSNSNFVRMLDISTSNIPWSWKPD